jgi:hypothetical protein
VSGIPALRVPSCSAVPNPSSITSDPAHIKQILFEFHSQLAVPSDASNAAAGFDPSFFLKTEQYVTDIHPANIGSPFCETPPTLDEITGATASLANHKASGLDMLFNEAIKSGGKAFESSLTALFQGFWQFERTPSIWAQATIHLIYKGHEADTLSPSSYRSISLTSCVSKVFEKVILERLDCYADEADLFPELEEQAGFRKGRSPIEQAFILLQILDTRKRMQRATTFLCFVDLQSAIPSTAAFWDVAPFT